MASHSNVSDREISMLATNKPQEMVRQQPLQRASPLSANQQTMSMVDRPLAGHWVSPPWLAVGNIAPLTSSAPVSPLTTASLSRTPPPFPALSRHHPTPSSPNPSYSTLPRMTTTDSASRALNPRRSASSLASHGGAGKFRGVTGFLLKASSHSRAPMPHQGFSDKGEAVGVQNLPHARKPAAEPLPLDPVLDDFYAQNLRRSPSPAPSFSSILAQTPPPTMRSGTPSRVFEEKPETNQDKGRIVVYGPGRDPEWVAFIDVADLPQDLLGPEPVPLVRSFQQPQMLKYITHANPMYKAKIASMPRQERFEYKVGYHYALQLQLLARTLRHERVRYPAHADTKARNAFAILMSPAHLGSWGEDDPKYPEE